MRLSRKSQTERISPSSVSKDICETDGIWKGSYTMHRSWSPEGREPMSVYAHYYEQDIFNGIIGDGTYIFLRW